MIKAVMFDLDGTLLPMDQNRFVESYFKLLCKKAAPCGYDAQELISSIWTCTEAMVKNNGKSTNEDVFWNRFAEIYGAERLSDRPMFDGFYRNEFENARLDCGFDPKAARTVGAIKNAGYRVVLSTNPIFPAAATEARIRWAGLRPDDFEIYTTYENSSFSKPNPMYYANLAGQMGLSNDECLVVGNDVGEDMVAADIGMKVFLMTHSLINNKNSDISIYPNGSFDELMKYMGL
ncbi:MAG: HAD family hydrolase [Clostridia bacterium]|nr:HAD family hydrolase [Clostridia bacterium]